ncbi:hypothetical protein BC938DRAFT_482372 [Jimgerdemannia flammicorona]|uniref:FAD-binding domain-containing protein n=1 Tax=Jimgerdemannia flammicorona TaxID=994334 RepID=A0A433QWJ3_9FUNG|nr:hypothetical protein BC938DRAFT_482372 [Jimgerdemannia flammicorona]
MHFRRTNLGVRHAECMPSRGSGHTADHLGNHLGNHRATPYKWPPRRSISEITTHYQTSFILALLMTQTQSDNNVLDVLVVGAGPVGLLLANELQLYGCKFRIIDKNDVGSIHSKAMGFVARTLETFDNR